MTKALQVMDFMIKNPKFITQTIQRDGEIYFVFKDRPFSISKRSFNGIEQFRFFVYPKWTRSLSDLVHHFENNPSHDVTMVSYVSDETGGEDRYSLLHKKVEEVHFGIDDLFDELLK